MGYRIRLLETPTVRSAVSRNRCHSIDIEAYVEDALVVIRGKRMTVNPKFVKHTAAWTKARQLAPFTVAAYCN